MADSSPILIPFLLRHLLTVLMKEFNGQSYRALSLVCKSFRHCLRITCKKIIVRGPYCKSPFWLLDQQTTGQLSCPKIASGECKSHQVIDPLVFPTSLEFLHLGGWTILPSKVKDLPFCLREIDFGSFNEPFDTADLPRSITRISFGSRFNQPISEKGLPPSLRSLSFGVGFAQGLTCSQLPRSLESLRLHGRYSSISNLPSSLTSLGFFNKSTLDIPLGQLPRKLTSLTFSCGKLTGEISQLPPSLTKLVFPLICNLVITAKDLPRSLIYLHLPCANPTKIICRDLPANLLHLSGNIETQDLQLLPSSLQELKLLNSSCQFAISDLPRNLTILTMPRDHGLLSLPDLPPRLKKLSLGYNFNLPFELTGLPASVKFVEMGEKFDQPFSWSTIPMTLKKLSFEDRFKQLVDIAVVKKTSCRVEVSSSHPDYQALLVSLNKK